MFNKLELMRSFPPTFTFIFFLLAGLVAHAQSGGIKLTPIATHYTDRFDQASAEIVAYDAASKRLFFSNAQANYVGILDISKPNAPVLVDSISMAPYGGGVNSVAVFNGKVAVAVESSPKTDPGKVVLFDAQGNFQALYTVGALPDMLVFTPDGTKILTANEGEPSDDYSVDPEGSVSIIDVAAGTVKNVAFTDFNTKAAALRNRGVRIFGKNATVAQDLEPEYLTITANGKKAYVTLQENNAIAIIDIATAKVIDIQALGYKDHLTGTPVMKELFLNELINMPELGTPVFKDSLPPVKLSGFSGLFFDRTQSNDSIYVLYTVPDRGPNDDPVPMARAMGAGNEFAFSDLRPFKLPNYQSRIVRFSYNKNTAKITLDSQILLTRLQNDAIIPISGRTNVIGYDEIPVTYAKEGTNYSVADWVDTLTKVKYTELQFDPFGADIEGVLKDREGNFWICDENRPSVYKLRPDGRMLVRYVPKGTSALGIIDLGPGSYGEETLPAVYRKRWANRGFEAIAYDSATHTIYAFIQSPIDNPASNRNKTDVLRILGINAATGAPVSEYVYLLENNKDYAANLALSRVDKIGDAVYKGNGTFLVLERDSSVPGQESGKKFVFEINITHATNLLADTVRAKLSAKETSSGATDKTLEMMSADDLAAAGIRPVYKRKVLNLPSIGYLPGDKPEGLALLPDGSIAVINDNDFGIAGAGSNDISDLAIISLGTNNSLDPSDRDNAVAIANHPVLGMFQPDAIASFTSNGSTYFVTANEGDARAYGGFNEEARVGASNYALDATAFPNAAALKANGALGRLRTTNASGDLDGDGDFDLIYTFGGRSFSVRDTFGNLVYDSGNEFEVNLSKDPKFSPYFNAAHDDNSSATKDSRSDDKGPEPEAIEIATIKGVTYALIGLERVGGIMVYDMTNPKQPKFAGYFNNRDFTANAQSRAAKDLGPEEILFIPADKSPNGMDLVVVSNEVSGTVTIFSTDEITDVDDPQWETLEWSIFPNPADGEIFSTVSGNYQVFNAFGQLMTTAQNTNRIDVSRLPAGTYILRYPAANASKVFVKQ